MGMLILGGALLAFGLMYLGLQRKCAGRRAARGGLFVLTLVCAGITAFCLYGSFAWSRTGGGVLLLFAMPAAFLNWLFGPGLFASDGHEAYYDSTVERKTTFNVALSNEVEADLHGRLLELMTNLPKPRAAVQRPEIHDGDER